MRANRAFELIVTRDSPEPRFLADPTRHDRVEVVSIADGEVVLFWELPAKAAAKLRGQLREDLVSFEGEELKLAWGLE